MRNVYKIAESYIGDLRMGFPRTVEAIQGSIQGEVVLLPSTIQSFVPLSEIEEFGGEGEPPADYLTRMVVRISDSSGEEYTREIRLEGEDEEDPVFVAYELDMDRSTFLDENECPLCDKESKNQFLH